ncbi:unnamed protein product [Periconia digitata]|uniref:Uncharacterized protein n=1 Tax=Periconia digitata TaxID=1303443 RepID=A0A9W4XL83_9PLEO|nr:unnamed protein product [Periconia digitata]
MPRWVSANHVIKAPTIQHIHTLHPHSVHPQSAATALSNSSILDIWKWGVLFSSLSSPTLHVDNASTFHDIKNTSIIAGHAVDKEAM